MEGWVGPRAGVDGEKTNFCPFGDSNPETVALSLHRENNIKINHALITLPLRY
jgi:hypothetical protein